MLMQLGESNQKAGEDGEESPSKRAMEYLKKIIKRDTKPSNPEKNIMIRLFDKMNRVSETIPYYDKLQKELRNRNKGE